MRCSTSSISSRLPDGAGDGYEDAGYQGIQAPRRIERDGELYHKQEMLSERRPSQVIKPSPLARAASSVTDNFGNRDNLRAGERRSKRKSESSLIWWG
jgi:hypothetical protein